MLRAAVLMLLAVLLFTAPATASSHQWLSKRDARAQAFQFTDSFADMLDPYATVHAIMVPPRKCRRIDHLTVSCRYHVQLVSERRTVYSHTRVHLQRDGIYGILMPLNIWKNTARPSKRYGLGLGQSSGG